MGRFFAAPRVLPQGSTLTPLILKVSGLVYNSAPQSEISYCTQFLRKKNVDLGLADCFESHGAPTLGSQGPLSRGPPGTPETQSLNVSLEFNFTPIN